MVQIMRANGIAVLVDRPSSGPTFRKLLLNIVIATDMSVHDKFMRRYQELVEGKVEDELERRILVCQAIIKCADISNPVSCCTRIVVRTCLETQTESAVHCLTGLGRCA